MGAVERELVEDTMDRLVNFLEMQAHDFSPEPRGMAGYTKANKNVWGRLFAFYATYPLAFYMTYMKKNPSEAGTIKSLTLLLMVSGFEMFHRQMKAIQNGENIEDLANKWAENPWAMLMREGSSAPWLGFGHNILRDALIMPTTAKFTGDKVYKPTPGLPAPVSVAFGLVEGVQDMVTKGPFTRGKRSNKAPNFMDFLMTGGDYRDADGNRAQASKAAQTLYDVFLTTKFLPFQMLERGFLEYVNPQPDEQGTVLAGAISPILGEMIANGEWEAARDMWRTIGKMHADRVNATKITVPSLKVPSEYRIPLLKESKERYKGPRRFSDEKMQNPSLGVTEDLLSTPQYLEVPLDLFN
tara:strand:+ start:137 stop:1201 length:1065 start_codon:yes stop_codon:yes gene_type:complete